jgi:hypothetical protein
MSSRSSHVGWMHVSIRLHLIHAVVPLGKAVAVLISVRRAPRRMSMHRLTGTAERLRVLLRRWCLESRRLAVHRRCVRGIRTRTSHSRADGITARRGSCGRRARLGLNLRKWRKTLTGYGRFGRIVRIVPGVYWASGVDRRDRWQLQLNGIVEVCVKSCCCRVRQDVREGSRV